MEKQDKLNCVFTYYTINLCFNKHTVWGNILTIFYLECGLINRKFIFIHNTRIYTHEN